MGGWPLAVKLSLVELLENQVTTQAGPKADAPQFAICNTASRVLAMSIGVLN